MNRILTILAITAFAATAGAGVAVAHSEDVVYAESLIAAGKPDSAAVVLYAAVDRLTSDDERVEALYLMARAMKELGRLDEEIHYLIRARELSPDVPYADNVRLDYARILLRTGNIESARTVAEEFMTRYADSPLMPDMMFLSGESHYKAGKYRQAFNTFSDIRERYPESDAAHEAVLYEGLCLYRLELLGGAIERFEQYLSPPVKGDNIATALYHLGESYEKRGQPEAALTMFNRLVIAHPGFPGIDSLYYRIGELSFRTGRYYEAENAFENYVFNTDPTSEPHQEALYYLERIRFQTGRYASEAEIAENFVAKYPESPRTPRTLFDLARYYRATGAIDLAVEKYKILMNNHLYTSHADSALSSIVNTYRDNGEYDRARSFLREEIRSYHDSGHAKNMYLRLGALAESLESYDEAIAWYDSTLSTGTSPAADVVALLGIGRSFRELNRWYEAASTFNRIIDDYPHYKDQFETYRLLADVYFLQGRIDDAIKAGEQALARAGKRDVTDILFLLARMYQEVDENHALRLYSRIYRNGDIPVAKRSNALLEFGELASRRGDTRSARKAFAEVIANDADSVSVSRAKKELDRIVGETGTANRRNKNQ